MQIIDIYIVYTDTTIFFLKMLIFEGAKSLKRSKNISIFGPKREEKIRGKGQKSPMNKPFKSDPLLFIVLIFLKFDLISFSDGSGNWNVQFLR